MFNRLHVFTAEPKDLLKVYTTNNRIMLICVNARFSALHGDIIPADAPIQQSISAGQILWREKHRKHTFKSWNNNKNAFNIVIYTINIHPF